jgi:hypothetical protein
MTTLWALLGVAIVIPLAVLAIGTITARRPPHQSGGAPAPGVACSPALMALRRVEAVARATAVAEGTAAVAAGTRA